MKNNDGLKLYMENSMVSQKKRLIIETNHRGLDDSISTLSRDLGYPIVLVNKQENYVIISDYVSYDLDNARSDPPDGHTEYSRIGFSTTKPYPFCSACGRFVMNLKAIDFNHDYGADWEAHFSGPCDRVYTPSKEMTWLLSAYEIDITAESE